jgi:translation elongation factor EF-Tu-like GTPase
VAKIHGLTKYALMDAVDEYIPTPERDTEKHS